VRTPVNVIGDIQSLIAAVRAAERRVREILEEFGRPSFELANALNQESSETVIRKRLQSLPSTTISMDEWVDYERGDEFSVHRISIKLTVDGGNAVVDLSESGEQANAPVNTCRAGVIGSLYTAFAQKLASDLPLNAGTFRPLRIEAGELGTIVNPRKPAPNSIGHVVTGARLVRGLSSLLTNLLQVSDIPELRHQVAGTGSDGLVRGAWVGRTDDAAPFAFLGQDQTPALGARSRGDGLDVGGLQFGLGIEITDLEISESLYPVLYLWRRLSPNSGGAGTFRGGLGVDLAWMPHGTPMMNGTLFCTVSRFPGRGELGGLPGSTGYMARSSGGAAQGLAGSIKRLWHDAEEAVWDDLPSYGAGVRVRRGDVVRVWSPGGGGIGDPAQRDLGVVAAEVKSGRFSQIHAERAYGVERRRAEGTEAGADGPSGSLVLPLRRKNGLERSCGHCDADLGRWNEPLERYAECTDQDLVGMLAALGVRIKDDLPGRLLRTLDCRGCGGVLTRSIEWQPTPEFQLAGRGLYMRVEGDAAAPSKKTTGVEAARAA